MRKNNYNEEVMNNLKPCGVLTCIHFIGGYCNRSGECELFERVLSQENQQRGACMSKYKIKEWD